MKKTLLAFIVLCSIFGCTRQESTPKFKSIQESLIPSVVVGDTTATTYSIEERMSHYHVPGVSIAVFKDGKIVWSNSIGVTDANQELKVNSKTRFQAASISKPVTALGILKLVEKYELDLDEDVNKYLQSWKLDSPFLENEIVTIRRLLSHTAGINIGGFQGYEKTDTIPHTTGILKGEGNTPQIELDTIPGSGFSYSGGGYVILQQLIEDVSGKIFEDYFESEVFLPLDMMNSTFNQFPEGNVSIAHDKEGKPYHGDWLTYPEQAAAGLWTTPVDLAKLCIAIESAYYGEEDTIISTELAKEMLTTVENWGLGVGLRGESQNRFFFHGGSNPGGYRSIMVDAFNARTGIIVMTNGVQGDKLHDEILRAFSMFFDISVLQPKYIQPVNLEESTLENFIGKYHFREMGDYYLEMSIDSNNQLTLYDPNDGMENTFLPINDSTFVERFEGLELTFKMDTLTDSIVSVDYNGAYTFYKVNE